MVKTLPEEESDYTGEYWTPTALQVLYLRRNWEILEFFKSLRTKVPIIFSGASLALTGYFLEFADAAQQSFLGWAMPSLLCLLAALGNAALLWVWRQYEYTDGKITYLYEQLDMLGPGFRDQRKEAVALREKREKAKMMFVSGHLSMAVIGVICVLGVLR